MKIGKEWQIKSDPLNIILSKRKVRTNKQTKEQYEDWEEAGYFSTIGEAIRFLVHQKVRDTQLEDLNTLNKGILRLEKLIEPLTKMPVSPLRLDKVES